MAGDDGKGECAVQARLTDAEIGSYREALSLRGINLSTFDRLLAEREAMEQDGDRLQDQKLVLAEQLAAAEKELAALRSSADALREQRDHARDYADSLARDKGPTLTHLWGQPVAEMRHALEFLEQHAGTTEIRAATKRLSLVLKGQRELIASQAKLLNTLTAESKTWELLDEWLRSSDLFLAKMSQEQGNAEPPPGWIVQLERDALCGETDVVATSRGPTLAAAILAALAQAKEAG